MMDMARAKAWFLRATDARRSSFQGIRDGQVLLDNGKFHRCSVFQDMGICNDPMSSVKQLASF
jgi:hypothetical protein